MTSAISILRIFRFFFSIIFWMFRELFVRFVRSKNVHETAWIPWRKDPPCISPNSSSFQRDSADSCGFKGKKGEGNINARRFRQKGGGGGEETLQGNAGDLRTAPQRFWKDPQHIKGGLWIFGDFRLIFHDFSGFLSRGKGQTPLSKQFIC